MPDPSLPERAASGRLAAEARRRGVPVAQVLVEEVAGGTEPRTLLAVCPTSRAVVAAALAAARAHQAPLFFAATLNQVDLDGGYTGWTPQHFVRLLQREAARRALEVPVLVGLDHGGPWKKDRHVRAKLGRAETRAAVERTLAACLDAGYHLLHLDPTVDLDLPGTAVPVDVLAARTADLMAHAEAHRRAHGLPPVAYEVGVEEVALPDGPDDGEARFAAFLEAFEAARTARGLPRALFAVGDVGTRLGSDAFDARQTRRLVAHARRYGLFVKAHYTDGIADLAAYPRCGVGGANVGPGLAEVEVDALTALARIEREQGDDSGFEAALQRAVVESGRWAKWLRADERGRPFDALAPGRQAWLVATGSRYVWTHPEVEAARTRLYANVASRLEAEAFVEDRLADAVAGYLEAFRLVGAAAPRPSA